MPYSRQSSVIGQLLGPKSFILMTNGYFHWSDKENRNPSSLGRHDKNHKLNCRQLIKTTHKTHLIKRHCLNCKSIMNLFALNLVLLAPTKVSLRTRNNIKKPWAVGLIDRSDNSMQYILYIYNLNLSSNFVPLLRTSTVNLWMWRSRWNILNFDSKLFRTSKRQQYHNKRTSK